MARKWKRKRYKDKAPSLLLHTCRQIESTKEPDEFDLWERDQSTISQIGDEFDSFIDGNPVLLGERGTSLSWWPEEIQRRSYPSLSRYSTNSSDVNGTRTCLLRVPAYHNVAANEAWCKCCGGRSRGYRSQLKLISNKPHY
jgi:hypothetical protein